MNALRTLPALALACALFGCSSTQQGPQRVTIVRPNETAPQTGGVPPDKQAEIQLVLQQREPSARRCYQEVLNEKHNRAFQGTVKLVITIDTTGKATEVKVAGGSLNDQQVQTCLVATIKEFEFPQLAQAGDVQYEYLFRPQY